jgi:hypothetical protein
MIRGTFTERPSDLHVRLRREMLGAGTHLHTPQVDSIRVASVRFPECVATEAQTAVARDGLALISLDGPVGADQFLSFGRYFGCAVAERDPSVQRFVQHDVLLNLVSEYEYTSDTALQPFAANELLLHSESSRLPIAEQPRYIALLCTNPGADPGQSQTVLVEMTDVAERLTKSERAILSCTRYAQNSHGPPILRAGIDREIFSFRDFGSQALDWTYFGDKADAGAVQDAFRALLVAIYGHRANGIRWAAGSLVIIDNMRFFHGRTRGATDSPSHRRHLMRLRLA